MMIGKTDDEKMFEMSANKLPSNKKSN